MITETATTAPQSSSPASTSAALWVLIALFVLGLASLVYGLSNKTIRPDFALFTASLLFLMGVSQAGVVFCAITRIVRAQWAKPYYRLAELSTLAFFPFAILGFLLIYFYARDDLFYWLTPSSDEHLSSWLNINWLLVRDLFGLLLFYGLSAVYVIKGLKPDMASHSKAATIDHRQIERQLYVLSPLVILAFVICNTLFAWDFAMMLTPHWHSTVFPIYFWFGNLFAGTAALIVFPALLAEGSFFGPLQIRYLGRLIHCFTLIWLYFFWAQFFVIWFGNLPHESDPLWRQMYGHYAPYYWTMMAGCFFVPFAALVFASVKGSLLSMCIISFGINLGIWINKYLMIVPVFSADDRPFDNWLDLSLSVGLLAGFLALLIWLARRLPLYSYWEINLKPEAKDYKAE
ncbi:MAG: hypothetical protein O7F73_17380 [Gammaproteobacteria bacterium]|nr:hypothetical protein [Gammaproteobacteria bacterium]